MDNSRTNALLSAVSVLVETEEPGPLVDALDAVLKLAPRYPVALVGEAGQLQPLVDLYCRDRAAYDRVMGLVDTKRGAAGRGPLRPVEEEKFDKTEYMRNFMDLKRQRQRRAVAIENMARPARDALVGRARLEFMDAAAGKWKVELDARLERARNAAGGRVPKETLDLLRKQFWEWVDEQLDAAENRARDRIRGKV